MNPRRQLLLFTATSTHARANNTAAAVNASAYPAQTITLIVPTAPSGPQALAEAVATATKTWRDFVRNHQLAQA